MNSSTNTKAFDYSAMLTRLDGDEELALDLLEMFLDLHEELLDRFGTAIATADGEQIWSATHRLKGSLKEVHATTATELAEQIEAYAKVADVAAAKAIGKQLEEATKQAALAISEQIT